MADFHIEKKMYYHDTDAGGVVYYGSYLKHLEEGRNEYCLSRGIDLVEYAANGVIFPVAHLELDYKRPARYGDTVQIFNRVDKIGRCSLDFYQEIKRGETILVIAKTLWVCVNKDMKPQAIPDKMRQAIQ